MSQIIAAPYCGQMLGDMGAEVIKIEVPQGGDVSRSYGPYRFGDPADGVGHGLSYYFCAFNRNKQSVTLNLRLIYCAISGYGRVGPDKDTAALDMAAQAASGRTRTRPRWTWRRRPPPA